MPESNISRVRDDVRERKFGEAPILGKVHRTPASAVRRKDGKRVKVKRRKRLPRFALAWMCLLLFVAACVVALVAVSYFRM